jgi:hypothetical protein
MLDETRASAKSTDVADLATVKAAYDRDGFVAIEGLLTTDEVEALRAEMPIWQRRGVRCRLLEVGAIFDLDSDGASYGTHAAHAKN